LIQQAASQSAIYAAATVVYPIALDLNETPQQTRLFAIGTIRFMLSTALGQSPVASDAQLTYPYSDIEQCWASCESLIAPP
jgi:hypothetical protein